MKKIYLLTICFLFSFYSYSQVTVYSRSESNTGTWWHANLPWYYDGWGGNSNRDRPDISDGSTTRHNIKIGHNVNTTMTVNDSWFGLRSLEFQAGASSNRILNRQGDAGISVTSDITNNSIGEHIFNIPIGID